MIFRRKARDTVTDEEFEILVQEIAERLKDLIYMNAESQVRECLTKLRDRILTEDPHSEIIINVEFTLPFNDLRQIIGRMRRQGV